MVNADVCVGAFGTPDQRWPSARCSFPLATASAERSTCPPTTERGGERQKPAWGRVAVQPIYNFRLLGVAVVVAVEISLRVDSSHEGRSGRALRSCQTKRYRPSRH